MLEQIAQTLLRVEGQWLTNVKVLQQIIVNYIALAAHRRSPRAASAVAELHALLLHSSILQNLEEYQTIYLDNELIQLGLLSLCEQLAHSRFHFRFHLSSLAEGCALLQAKHIFQRAAAVLEKFPANSEICLSLVRTIFAMNLSGGRFAPPTTRAVPAGGAAQRGRFAAGANHESLPERRSGAGGGDQDDAVGLLGRAFDLAVRRLRR